jgi:NAD(P)-dependent dehydrogenase (short-subunit alcohol dehydrogenase family)
MTMGNLTNKKVIVTGATSGIGQAIAIRCAREGADIAFCGLTADGSAETIAGIESVGQRAFFQPVDLADVDAARAFGVWAVDQLGGVDGLVNNAGANLWHGVEHATFEQLDRCLRVNVYHAWVLTQVCIAPMRAAGGGVVVNMSSIHGQRTIPGVFPYSMAKAMLLSFTQSIAIEHGRDNIRAVAIQPGLIMTALADEYFNTFPDPAAAKARMTSNYPLNRGGKPDEVAATVAHVLSGENAFMSGSSIVIDGGLYALAETPDNW